MKWLTAALLTIAAVLGGLLLLRGSGAEALGGTALDPAPKTSAMPMVGDDGQPAMLGGPAGQVRLVFFGFTRCPDVCPLTLGRLSKIYQQLSVPQQQQLQVQLVSVDPQHDSPDRLRSYLDNFDKAFRGLTGTAAQAKAAADTFFILDTKAENGNILHGDQIAVLDRQGRFRRVYDGSALGDGQLGADLPKLIKLY
ncbi:SCO family protein [Deinococcus irradiatisoli]|uniref:SCO family protein n=1 Tax=Deinococcus irradiatisoli TaxID=2202254 RepID=A0A2Z3JSZ5_9DEIO|nr:SCO family protein [Deinococcus irradiatisoli]AWN23804.1 SCO family protein [Deinococcus irradiatisoli]